MKCLKKKRLIKKYTNLALFHKMCLQQHMWGVIPLDDDEYKSHHRLMSVYLRIVRRLKYGELENNEQFPRIDKL